MTHTWPEVQQLSFRIHADNPSWSLGKSTFAALEQIDKDAADHFRGAYEDCSTDDTKISNLGYKVSIYWLRKSTGNPY